MFQLIVDFTRRRIDGRSCEWINADAAFTVRETVQRQQVDVLIARDEVNGIFHH